jgi:hypothetical protein
MAGLHCPCADLKRGAADLAIAASMAVQPQIFFGGDLVPAVTAALHGTAAWEVAAPLILWVVTLAVGLFQSLQGYRAAQWHRDPFNVEQFTRSLGAGLLCLYALYAGWALPLEWGALVGACGRCVLLAGVAYNTAGVWLQLRGPVALLFVRQRQNYFAHQWEQPPQDSGAAAQLAEHREVMDSLAQEVEQSRQERVIWQDTVAARERTINEIASERDGIAAERDYFAGELVRETERSERYLTSGKNMAAERRDIKTVRMLPGVERALEKAVHPNAHGGKSAAEVRAFNDGFVKLKAIYQRLKAER